MHYFFDIEQWCWSVEYGRVGYSRSEMYLAPCQTYAMELFFENRQWLKIVNNCRKIAPFCLKRLIDINLLWLIIYFNYCQIQIVCAFSRLLLLLEHHENIKTWSIIRRSAVLSQIYRISAVLFCIFYINLILIIQNLWYFRSLFISSESCRVSL